MKGKERSETPSRNERKNEWKQKICNERKNGAKYQAAIDRERGRKSSRTQTIGERRKRFSDAKYEKHFQATENGSRESVFKRKRRGQEKAYSSEREGPGRRV